MDPLSALQLAQENRIVKTLKGWQAALLARLMALWLNGTPAGRVMGAAGFVSLAPIMGIVGTVLIVIIVVLVLAALAPTFFQAVADITGALLSADLNSTLANTIAAIVAILVPLALLFGFVVLIFRATKMSGR